MAIGGETQRRGKTGGETCRAKGDGAKLISVTRLGGTPHRSRETLGNGRFAGGGRRWGCTRLYCAVTLTSSSDGPVAAAYEASTGRPRGGRTLLLSLTAFMNPRSKTRPRFICDEKKWVQMGGVEGQYSRGGPQSWMRKALAT